VIVLSDSCHSGTVTRARPQPGQRSKQMPPTVALRTYQAHKAFYDKLQLDVAKASDGRSIDPDAALANAHTVANNRLTQITKKAKAAVILISGCQDNQTSMDGDHNGAFTEQLLHVWNDGSYQGNYVKFHAAIKSRLPSSQTPNLFLLGATARFAKQQPFSV
jgi:hypothetical protein